MKRLVLLGLAAIVALAAFAPTAGGKFRPEHCTFRREGPPGPAGNRLFVFAEYTVGLLRRGDEIRVSYAGPRCKGPKPTIWNTDLIVVEARGGEGVFINEHRGRIEQGGARVRIRSRRLDYLGTPGRDRIVAGMTRDGHVGLDLVPSRPGSRHKYDLVFPEGIPRTLRLYGENGRDLIDARRLRRMGDRHERHKLWLVGEHGRDTLLGSPGAETRIEDGAGAGNDEVWMGLGHDLVFGGTGNDSLEYAVYERFTGIPADVPDRLFGGPGQDRLSDLNRRPDLLRCGPGRDEAVREPRDRPAADCEKQPR